MQKEEIHKKIEEIEILMAGGDFWADKDRAQATIKEYQNLKDALENADVFIGMSAKNVLIPEWVDGMAEKPIVFALANPDPEIDPKSVKKTKIAVFGTGRSDLPNQINNVLAFPGIFRGALDADARQITDEMKLAAAKAIASLVPAKKLSATYIVPDPFDKRVALAVARAVKKVARK